MADAFQIIRLLFSLALTIVSGILRLAGAILAHLVLPLVLRLLGQADTPSLKSFRAPLRAVDGDSLVARHAGRQIKIRLFGIDAPEFDQPEGPAATRALRALVEGREAVIQPVETDRYGRLVARVLLEDDTDVAAELVRAGLALADSRFTRAYTGLERAAREDGAGFWGRGGLVDPAEWRALKAAR